MAETGQSAGLGTDLASALAAVTAERDQERQMLTDAPHGDTFCTAGEPYGQAECVCWKAGL